MQGRVHAGAPRPLSSVKTAFMARKPPPRSSLKDAAGHILQRKDHIMSSINGVVVCVTEWREYDREAAK